MYLSVNQVLFAHLSEQHLEEEESSARTERTAADVGLLMKVEKVIILSAALFMSCFCFCYFFNLLIYKILAPFKPFFNVFFFAH